MSPCRPPPVERTSSSPDRLHLCLLDPGSAVEIEREGRSQEGRQDKGRRRAAARPTSDRIRPPRRLLCFPAPSAAAPVLFAGDSTAQPCPSLTSAACSPSGLGVCPSPPVDPSPGLQQVGVPSFAEARLVLPFRRAPIPNLSHGRVRAGLPALPSPSAIALLLICCPSPELPCSPAVAGRPHARHADYRRSGSLPTVRLSDKGAGDVAGHWQRRDGRTAHERRTASTLHLGRPQARRRRRRRRLCPIAHDVIPFPGDAPCARRLSPLARSEPRTRNRHPVARPPPPTLAVGWLGCFSGGRSTMTARRRGARGRGHRRGRPKAEGRRNSRRPRSRSDSRCSNDVDPSLA